MKQEVLQLDADGKVFGRLASHVATLLRGKHTISFRPNANPGIKVLVTNIAKVGFTGTKMETKKYYSFSGYPGGLKTRNIKDKFEKDPIDLFVQAVKHMLPKNRLAGVIIKNLTVKKGD